MKKKILIVSGINLFEGGTLSIIQDCLSFLESNSQFRKYKIIALVHKKVLFKAANFNNIEFIEFPKSRKSYFYRIYYEYFYFKNFAKKNKIYFWLSLHDITPSLKNVAQAVYCHNPSPFQKVKLSDLFDQPKMFFFTLFYKYLYSINIKKNKFVIVQQTWIKNAFVKEFSLISDKVIVAPPKVPKKSYKKLEFKSNYNIKSKFVFFYPTLSRPFKNIEVICEAANLLVDNGIGDFEIVVTVDGTENNYSKRIVEKYSYIKNINFIGRISREEVYNYYNVTDCLLFPSKLETWGLPISEFKQFDKPIFLSDLPYAKETGGDYDKLKFFNPDSKNELFECIKDLINGEIEFDLSNNINKSGIIVNDWDDLFLNIIK